MTGGMAEKSTMKMQRMFVRMIGAATATAAALLLALPAGGGADAGGADGAAQGFDGDGWRFAQPGWEYSFPRDHHAHPGFKTEWWYVTGHLATGDGRELGYQVTFFRQGMQPPALLEGTRSRWLTGDLHLAHAAFSDKARGRFEFDHRLNRGAFGEAGNAPPPAENDDAAGGNGAAADPDKAMAEPRDDRVAWNDDWEMRWRGDRFSTSFSVGGHRFDLELEPLKPAVFHGRDGFSRKGPGEGAGSHYYSFTRIRTTGTVRGPDGVAREVEGESWMDREWSTSVLSDGQVGWDWFSLQLDDGRELMAFQLRREDGGVDRHNHGTLVDTDGSSRHLEADEFTLEPLRHWRSPDSGAQYPVAWRVTVDELGIDLEVEAEFDRQELVLTPVTYWEGALRVTGSHPGRGFLEMTGYAGAVEGLR